MGLTTVQRYCAACDKDSLKLLAAAHARACAQQTGGGATTVVFGVRTPTAGLPTGRSSTWPVRNGTRTHTERRQERRL